MGLDEGVTDHSTSVNPLGMHHTIHDILKNSLRQSTVYPDIYNLSLEQKISRYLDMEPRHVTATNGATDAIYNVCRYMTQRPVLMQVPIFSEYVAAAKLYNCTVKLFQTNNVARDKDKFIQAIPCDGCVFVCNPTTPVGRLTQHDIIHDIIRAGRDANSTVVVDECFIELTPGKNESALQYMKRYNNLIIIRTMTKSFGLAGLRVGYFIAGDAITHDMRQYRIPWCVGTLAQMAAEQALSHPEHIMASHDIIRRQMPYIHSTLSESPYMEPVHSDTNYMVIRTRQPAVTIQRRLLRHNILVRDCTSFGMPYHIRISTKTGDKDKILCERLIESCHV